jgi:hypothetical protein
MNRFFPLPIYSFLKIAMKNGGFALGGLWKIPGWLLKTIVFEPFRWVELAFYNRKIARHTIKKPPIFILGFYRSGTSYLHDFFTQDDRLGYHSTFEMIFPEIMLTTERWMCPAFDFIFRLFRLQDPVHRTPLALRFPGEEDGSMSTSLNPRGAAWGYFFPEKMDEYFRKYVLYEGISASEKSAWVNDYLFLLKKISLFNQGKQLVLKSPPNTARIKLLLSLFPDAKFILIHRNPYEVYASNKRFLKLTHKIYALGKTKSVDIKTTVLDTYGETMQRYFQEKDLIPKGQLIEMAYNDFVQNPVDNMRKAYDALQLDNFNYCAQNMQAYADRQKKFKILQYQLPPDETRMVSEKLEYIIRKFNYPML